MQTDILSFSPGFETVYDLILQLLPDSGGINSEALWSLFMREYLSDPRRAPRAAIPLLKERKRPVPAIFNEFLWRLCVGDILTCKEGRYYRLQERV